LKAESNQTQPNRQQLKTETAGLTANRKVTLHNLGAVT